jgi:hypothetical protein
VNQHVRARVASIGILEAIRKGADYLDFLGQLATTRVTAANGNSTRKFGNNVGKITRWVKFQMTGAIASIQTKRPNFCQGRLLDLKRKDFIVS